MARGEFRYTINAQDKSRNATRSAQKNMDGMETSAKKLGKTLKKAFAVTAIIATGKKIAQVSGQLIDAYSQQESAERKLAAAAASNPMLNRDGVERLQDFASELQSVTTVGDEVALSFAGMLASFGRSEEEIQKVITAASDLSAATGISLDSAVRNLNKTFGGMTGELGELVPELKNLTEEQLRSGEAVDYIAEQFAGMGEAMAGGVEGARKQLENAMGDLQEAFGGILGPLQQRTLEKLQPIIETATQWINDHANQILNFFLNFPEVVSVSMSTVADIIRRIFTADYLRTAVAAMWEYFKAQAMAVLNFTWEYIKGLGQFIWEPLKVGFDWVVYGIRTAWRNVVDFITTLVDNTIIVAINGIIEGLEAVINKAGEAAAWVRHPFNEQRRQELRSTLQVEFGGVGRIGTPQRDALERPGGVDFRAMLDALKGVGEAGFEAARQMWDNYKQLGASLTEPFSDITQQAISDITEVLNRDLPEGMRLSAAELTDALTQGSEEGAEEIEVAMSAGARAMDEIMGDAVVGFRDAWDDLQGIYSSGGDGGGSGPMDAIAGSARDAVMGLEGFAGMIAQSTAQFGALGPVVAAAQVVIGTLAQALGPAINQVLAPLVQALANVGMVIAQAILPVLQALAPIVQVIAQLMNVNIAVLGPFIDIIGRIIGFLADLLLPVFKQFGLIIVAVSAPFQYLGAIVTWIADTFQWMGRALDDFVHNLTKPIWEPAQNTAGSFPNLMGYLEDAGNAIGDQAAAIRAIGTGTSEPIELGEIDLGDYGGDYEGGGGASYTTGRNITVNVDIETEVIAGEEGVRGLALMIRDEIRAAEALGA